jgi:hypothetical protein
MELRRIMVEIRPTETPAFLPPIESVFNNNDDSSNIEVAGTSRTDNPLPKEDQKLENQPGTAMAERLQNELQYKPGNKAIVNRLYPGAQGAFNRELKSILKEAAVKEAAAQFALGATPDEARKAIHAKLTSLLGERTGLAPKVQKVAQDYIEKHYGGNGGSPHFWATAEGGEFVVKGTNLTVPIIRSRNMHFFKKLSRIDARQAARLLSDTGLNHAKKTTTLGTGARGKVTIAVELKAEGNEFVAAKEYMNLRRGANEQMIVSQLKDSRYFSGLREPATLTDKAYLFMDVAGCGNCVDVQNRINSMTDANAQHRAEFTLATHYIKAIMALKTQDPPIYHLDIKPDNFLLKKDGSVILVDFDASSTEDKYGRQPGGGHIAVGSPHFRDPRWKEQEASAADADKYSLGATLFTLATGEFYVGTLGPGGRGVDPNWKGSDSANLQGNNLREVALKLMDKDPANRPELDKLFDLPYFASHMAKGDLLSNDAFVKLVMDGTSI